MQAVVDFLRAHGAQMAAVVYALANLANALIKDPEAKSIIGKVVDVVSFLVRAEAQGTVKMPLVSMSKARPMPPSLHLVFALFCTLTLGASGCLPSLAACRSPDLSIAPKCHLEQDLIACGEKSGLDLLPIVVDVVMSAIGGTFDPSALVSQLESEGFNDVPCLLAAVENYFMPAAPQIAGKVHMALVMKLAKDGHHGLVTISRGRSMVSVYIP